MKPSLAITALILAAFAAAGWWQCGAVYQLRAEQLRLVSQAAALGLQTGDGPSAKSRHRSADRPSVDREAEARTYAADLIRFVKEMGDDPDESDAATQEAIIAIIERMYRLDPGQIRVLLDELRQASDLPEDARQEIIGFAIESLAESRPEAAILLLSETRDPESRNDMIETILDSWAGKDPLAALDWLRTNNAGGIGSATEEIKFAMVTGCARNNPKLAFQWITDLQIASTSSAVPKIVESARTPEARHAMFSALRELATVPTADRYQSYAFGTLAREMAEQGYDTTQSWLATINPTPEEAAILAHGLQAETTRTDSGKWIEWMGDHVPPDQLKDRAQRLMNDWTWLDYQAAGDWLATTPESAVKRLAVASYAKTVAPYEPAIAAQWAETLPANSDRADLMRSIHNHWHQIDPAAAAAFAKKHGVGIAR
jgi:hypothetical protein